MNTQDDQSKGFLGGWKGLKELIPNNKEIFSQIFTSLHSRNYRNFFYGQIVSNIGSFIQSIALSWLVYRLTGSVLLLATVTFVTQIPSFFLTPITGVLVDRIGKRNLLIGTQAAFMIQAFALAFLVLSHTITVWQIVGLSLIMGIIHAFDIPARQVIIIDLVDQKEDLGNAIALNSAMFNSARIIGTAIGGLLIGIIGEGYCILLNAFTYIAVLIPLFKIHIPENSSPVVRKNIVQEMNEGFTYVIKSVSLRSALLMTSVISFFGFSMLVFLPAFVKDILRGDSTMLGFMMSSFGGGALVAALYLAARKSVLGLGKIIMLSTFLIGIGLIGLSFVHVSWIAYVLGFPLGFSLIASVASLNTQLQTLSDNDYQGRVMSFYTMALMGVVPIGSVILGYLEGYVGLSILFMINGVVLIIASLIYENSRPNIRKHMRKIYVEKGIVTEIASGLEAAKE
ncbi:MAG: MFS transporter [Bacteroidales bacterium]